MKNKSKQGLKTAKTRVSVVELDFSTWKQVISNTIKTSIKDRITLSAASLAFHWFLAIFPALIAITGIFALIGLSPAELKNVVHGIRIIFPANVVQVLEQSIKQPPGGSQVSYTEVFLGTLVALWSAIEAMSALQISLDMAFETQKDRGFLKRRLMGTILLLFSTSLGVVAFVLFVLGAPLGSFISHNVGIAPTIFRAIWTLIRFLVSIFAVMLLVSIYYFLGPNKDNKHFDWVSPGSLIAVLGWLVSSILFSFYLNHFGHQSSSYGAFAGVVTLLLWLFLSSTTVLLGAELDRELERQNQK